MRRIINALAIALLSQVALGQESPPIAFEVASVKPSTTQRILTRSTYDGIVYQSVTLRFCIINAYHVRDFQISGPSWLGDLRYDIVAKNSQAGPQQIGDMLRTLLADRFQLQIHHETKEFPGYALTVAAGEFQLVAKPVDPNAAMPPSIYGGIGLQQFPDGHMRLIGKNASMTALATDLSIRLGSPVIDRTNKAGNYDFAVDVSPEDIHPGVSSEDSLNPSGVSVFDSIQKLGLKLKTQKVPLDVIVVDRAEKIPTEN